jgi:valyl-tRNA synthetase
MSDTPDTPREFPNIPEVFLKPYNPQAAEAALYEKWEKSGYFNPDNLPQVDGKDRTEPFSIVMPPPNANGSLHAGHALFVTLEDLMTRYARMQGKKALWVPHATCSCHPHFFP